MTAMPVDNGAPAVHKRGYRPPGGESTVQLTWSDNPDVPRSPAPSARPNGVSETHGFIMPSEDSPVGRPTIRMHQVEPLGLRHSHTLRICVLVKLVLCC